jgi:nucleoside-diphosphate-sugar epimerase
MKTYTILGSGGAIGAALVPELQQLPNSAIRTVQRRFQTVPPPHEHVTADLTRAAEVERAIQGSEAVFLTVGFPYRIAIWQKEWPRLIQNTIAACEKHGAKLIFFDNVYMYPTDAVSHMTETTAFLPKSRKGAVRSMVATAVLDAIQGGRIQGMIARSADFYGPGVEQTSVLYQMVFKPLLAKQKPMWPVNAHVPHSFTYVPDAAKALVQLVQAEDAFGQTWHLPTANPGLTGQAWVDLASKILGRENPSKAWALSPAMISILGLLMKDLAESREMLYQYDQPYAFVSKKFEDRFGWVPTAYETGAQAVLDHALKQGN